MSKELLTTFHGETDIDDRGEVVFVEEDGTKHDADFFVDWKADPEAVMAEVNKVLRKYDVAGEFVSLQDGSDQFLFEFVEDEFEDWGSIGPPS